MITTLIALLCLGFLVWLLLQVNLPPPFPRIIVGTAVFLVVLFMVKWLAPMVAPLVNGAFR